MPNPLQPLPHTKLMTYLKAQPMGSEVFWCDHWRGFWDATRSLRPKGPAVPLGRTMDEKEYQNGYATGKKADDACTKRRKSPGGL